MKQNEQAAEPEHSPWAKGVEWPVLLFIGLVHVFALALCFAYPSTSGFWLCIGLYVLTGLGVTIGYHRKLTHHSFKSPKWVDRFLAVLGLLAGEGPPVFWVAHHRKHHKLSDLPGDPHSPNEGFWWSHWLWLFPKQNKVGLGALYKKWAPDLARVPFYQHLEGCYAYWHLASAVILFGIGYAIGGFYLGMSYLAYGFFLRVIIVLHATWMVNSVAHTWGYRTYETTDMSRNNALVGLLAHGEGWHNNHHHMQAAVNHGHHRWWEFDLSFYVICFFAIISLPFKWLGLEKMRLVSNLKFYSWREKKYVTWFPAKKA